MLYEVITLFKREGQDVICETPISFPQAALGCEIEVPTVITSYSIHYTKLYDRLVTDDLNPRTISPKTTRESVGADCIRPFTVRPFSVNGRVLFVGRVQRAPTVMMA